MKGVETHSFNRLLRYCAGVNHILTKAGLPALVEAKVTPNGEFGEFTFRGVLFRFTHDYTTGRADITIAPPNLKNLFFNPNLIDNLAYRLAENVDNIPDDCIANVQSSTIVVQKAPAHVAAMFAVATMIGSTRFDEAPYEVFDQENNDGE